MFDLLMFTLFKLVKTITFRNKGDHFCIIMHERLKV